MAIMMPDEGLQTNDDRDMGPFKEGVSVYEERQALKAAAYASGRTERQASASSLPWSTFLLRHPDYDAELWEEVRALYAGGPKLLRNDKLMNRLLPAHRGEDGEVYKERKKRAHYFPYAGAIIDHLVAGLAADPVSIQAQDAEGENTDEALPEWWSEFLEDVSPQGGKRQSCQQLLVDQVREALITRCSWTLIDLPQTPEEYVEDAPDSLLAQEKAGLLDPYAIAIDPEYVIDWQDDQNGELEWALICDTELRRPGLSEARRNVTKTFTYYDRLGWTRYQITYDPKEPPKPETPVPRLDEGLHAFTKVPLIRMKLPEGLWAMGKLESLAREHFNKRNAQAWAEYKSLFKILYEFMAPEEGTSMQPVSDAQGDPDRAVAQIRGQGYSQLRGHQDRAEFIGPDASPFAEARASCDQIMREMHRVMFVMSLSVDMGSAQIRRSGESKAQDKNATTVILLALGKYLRDAMRDMVELVGYVKGELDPRVSGAESFDSTDVAGAVAEAVELLNGVPIKSATFKKAYLLRTYKTVMGDELTEDELQEIREELEESITAEDTMMEAGAMALATMAQGGQVDDDDDDDEFEDAEDEREVKRAAANGQPVKGGQRGRTMFDSRGKR